MFFNLSKLRYSMKIIYTSLCTTGKEMLIKKIASSGHFLVGGGNVCSAILNEAFRFSAKLQSLVRPSFWNKVGSEQ